MVDLEKLQFALNDSGANFVVCITTKQLAAIIAELTALRAKVAAGERLRNGVAGAADDYGFDSEMVEFADDIRGRVAEYDAAVKP